MFANIINVVRAIWAFFLYFLSILKDGYSSSSDAFELPIAAPQADKMASHVNLIATVAPVIPTLPSPIPIAGSSQCPRSLRAEATGGPSNSFEKLEDLGAPTYLREAIQQSEKVVKNIADTQAPAPASGAPFDQLATVFYEDNACIAAEFQQIKDTILDTPMKQKDKWSSLLNKCVTHFSVEVGDESTDITLVAGVRVAGNTSGRCPLMTASSSSPSLSEGSNDDPESPFPTTPSGDLARFTIFKFPSPPPLPENTLKRVDDVFGMPTPMNAHGELQIAPPPFMMDDEEPGPIGEGSPMPSCPPKFGEDLCFPTADCLFVGIETTISFSSLLSSPDPQVDGQVSITPRVFIPSHHRRRSSCASDHSVAELWRSSPIQTYPPWSPSPPRSSLPRRKTSTTRTQFHSICDVV